jgi:hypothetical protein
MKKRLLLSRETLRRLHVVADPQHLRQPAGGAVITTTNPSVVDGCPSTPVWCPQYTQKPCPEPTTVAGLD